MRRITVVHFNLFRGHVYIQWNKRLAHWNAFSRLTDNILCFSLFRWSSTTTAHICHGIKKQTQGLGCIYSDKRRETYLFSTVDYDVANSIFICGNCLPYERSFEIVSKLYSCLILQRPRSFFFFLRSDLFGQLKLFSRSKSVT